MEWQSYIDGCGCGRANASTEEEEEENEKNQYYSQDFTVFTTDAEARRQYV